MRQPASTPAQPGSVLLRIASVVFDPAVVDDVVTPTIGDLRREVAAAGADRAQRRRALWRGYRAFWTLVLLSPMAFRRWTAPSRPGTAFPDIADRIAFSLIGVTVISSILLVAGRWTVAPAIGSALVAMGLHAWWRRHPSQLALPEHGRRPEINLSAIPVGGDIGGLIFVVGSVLIVTAGIPMVRWFLIGVVVGGATLGVVLTHWRAAHASRATPTTIVAR